MAFKRVLIVAQVIPQWYLDVLTKALGDGVKIDVITGSKVQGNVIASPSHDPKSFSSRLRCWLAHAFFVEKWRRKHKDKSYDLIFAISNPPINPYLGLRLKKQFQAPFYYMNWDLYPQVIEKSIKNPAVGLLCKCWHGWNGRNYPKIDKMFTIGQVMADSLQAPLPKKIPVTVLPIGVDTAYLKPVAKQDNPFAKEQGLTDKFVMLYAGKMGLGHNIEVLLEAASLLEEKSDMVFVFMGEGPKRALVEAHIEKRGQKNVRLLAYQSAKMFPYAQACADVALISQEENMAQLFMPSKAYSALACGAALLGICSSHDDLRGLIEEKECGVALTGASAEAVAEALVGLYEDGAALRRYQENARAAAEESFAEAVLVERYREVFAAK